MSTTGRQRRERNEGRLKARLEREQRCENACEKRRRWRRNCILWPLLWLALAFVGVGGGLGCRRALQLQQHENEQHSYVPADGTTQHTTRRTNERGCRERFLDRAGTDERAGLSAEHPTVAMSVSAVSYDEHDVTFRRDTSWPHPGISAILRAQET